jgi:hypothetical protein
MHRSGTSAITKILIDIGYALPGKAIPASWDNPKGYWEPLEIVDIHNAFLQEICRSWSDPRPLAEELFHGKAATKARQKLQAAMEQIVLPNDRWVLKDPRMCRLMPLWDELLGDGSNQPHYLHILRSPLSVAASLTARDGFGERKSSILWLRHYLESEAATRGKDRAWLHFEKLTDSSPADFIERFRTITSSPHLSEKRIESSIESNLDRTLVHHEHELKESLERLQEYPWIADAYQAFELLGTDREQEGLDTLDELRAEIATADSMLLGDADLWEEEIHSERYFRLSNEIEAQRREIEAQRSEVNALRDELSTEHEQLASVYQVITRQSRATKSWFDNLALWQAAVDRKHQGVSESLSELTGLMTELLQSSGSDQEHLEAADRSPAIARKDQHLTLLHKSLDALSRIESHWVVTREQLAAAIDERDAAMQRHDETLEARDRLLRERNKLIQDLDTSREELDTTDMELESTREELEATKQQLDATIAEINQLMQRRSWKITAPIRWFYKLLRK